MYFILRYHSCAWMSLLFSGQKGKYGALMEVWGQTVRSSKLRDWGLASFLPQFCASEGIWRRIAVAQIFQKTSSDFANGTDWINLHKVMALVPVPYLFISQISLFRCFYSAVNDKCALPWNASTHNDARNHLKCLPALKFHFINWFRYFRWICDLFILRCCFCFFYLCHLKASTFGLTASERTCFVSSDDCAFRNKNQYHFQTQLL